MSLSLSSTSRLPELQQIPQPKQSIKTCKALGIVSLISLATFYCGYCIAYIVALGAKNLGIVYGSSTAIPVIKGFCIAMIPYGICFGTFLSPWVVPLATRRNLTLILCILAECLEGIVQIEHVVAFFIVRFLQGTVCGLFLSVIPLYIRQITPKQLTTNFRFGIFQKAFLLGGIAAVFGYNAILLKKDVDQLVRWRIVVTANALPIFILLVLILLKLVPESPNSLIQKGLAEQAKQVIELFQPKDKIEQIFQQKVKQIQNIVQVAQNPPPQKISKLKTFLTFQVPITHQLTGVNAYISQMGFITSLYNFEFSEYVPFLMSATQFCTLLLSVLYISKMTPKVIILIGNLGMSFCCFAIAASLIIIGSDFHAFWSSISFLALLLAFNGATFIPVIGAYVAQVGSKPAIRWSGVTNWFVCGSTIVILVTIGSNFGYGTVFLIFGTCSMIGFVINIIWMVETRPKSVPEVNIQLQPSTDKPVSLSKTGIKQNQQI